MSLSDIENLLQKTSRTFALTIPCLPQPTRDEVGIAYLLFRIIDTFEDATLWSPEKRQKELRDFIPLLDGPASAAQPAAAEWARNPPLVHAGYQELLARTPYVLERFEALRPEARQILRTHVARSAEGMSGFVARTKPEGRLARQEGPPLGGVGARVLQDVHQLQPFAEGRRALAQLRGDGLDARAAQHEQLGQHLAHDAGHCVAVGAQVGDGLQLQSPFRLGAPDEGGHPLGAARHVRAQDLARFGAQRL